MVLNDLDTSKAIALEILHNELNIIPALVTRFPTGYCHCVYYVKTDIGEYVLRVTNSKWHYDGSVKWLNELIPLEIPIPQMLKYGQYKDVYYALITYIHGRDIGEVYHTLNSTQKHEIVKEIAEIQRKVATLPPSKIDDYENYSHASRIKGIENRIQWARKNITINKVFDPAVCDAVADLLCTFKDYLANVKPVAFLDDISTKNVLIHNGKLAGIVDIDEMGYGDPLEVVGLMNMALLAMNADTKYVDYWLDEMHACAMQRKAMMFYSLISCIGFMGERGTKFDNGKAVPVNQDEVALFNTIYHGLISGI